MISLLILQTTAKMNCLARIFMLPSVLPDARRWKQISGLLLQQKDWNITFICIELLNLVHSCKRRISISKNIRNLNNKIIDMEITKVRTKFSFIVRWSKKKYSTN